MLIEECFAGGFCAQVWDASLSDEDLRRCIEHVKECSGFGGMEEEQYFRLMTYVREHAPQRLLVWGVGFDSVLLAKLNRHGQTVFLEPSEGWAQTVRACTSDLQIVVFDQALLQTSVLAYPSFMSSPHRADSVDLLRERRCWDTVFIDSPPGISADSAGRAVPIYTAWVDLQQCLDDGDYLPDAEIAVFVHDSERELEDAVSIGFFTSARLVWTAGQEKKLSQFAIKHEFPSQARWLS